MKQKENFKYPGKRQLKVYERYITRTGQQYILLPEIRLCGKWLQDLGFDCGRVVTVQHEKNKIIIMLDNEVYPSQEL